MITASKYYEQVNYWIENYDFPIVPTGLYEPICYALNGGGKRLRPTLLCASAEAFGVDLTKVKHQALGIEFFHNFTLLHDDIMDNADIRHGRPTVHKVWNVSTAILSGDTMLTLASQLMSNYGNNDIVKSVVELFNKTAIEVYEGQQYDMNFENSTDITLEQYIEMIRLKTAVLLGCACRIGSIVAGVRDEDQKRIYNFGQSMGLAFQLRDDYLDSFGDVASFGKAIGGDILNDKKTWLQIRVNELSNNEVALKAKSLKGEEKIKYVIDTYKSFNVDKECLSLIDNYTNNAISFIDAISCISDEYKNFFKSLALKSVSRQS